MRSALGITRPVSGRSPSRLIGLISNLAPNLDCRVWLGPKVPPVVFSTRSCRAPEAREGRDRGFPSPVHRLCGVLGSSCRTQASVRLEFQKHLHLRHVPRPRQFRRCRVQPCFIHVMIGLACIVLRETLHLSRCVSAWQSQFSCWPPYWMWLRPRKWKDAWQGPPPC